MVPDSDNGQKKPASKSKNAAAASKKAAASKASANGSAKKAAATKPAAKKKAAAAKPAAKKKAAAAKPAAKKKAAAAKPAAKKKAAAAKPAAKKVAAKKPAAKKEAAKKAPVAPVEAESKSLARRSSRKPLRILRIKLRSFDYKQIDTATETILRNVRQTGGGFRGPIPLPVKRERYDLLRSPHVFKDSREQIEIRTYHRLVDVLDPSKKTADALVKVSLPAGVDANMKEI